MSEDRLRAAVATGVLASERQHRMLLQSIVEVARAIFGAKASSIFVLDGQSTRFALEEMELLGLFANQAAIALDLLGHARRARRVLDESPVDVGVVARLAATVEALEDERREAGLRLLGELENVLRP